MPQRSGRYGICCIIGALVGLIWAVVNSVYPNSVGSPALGNFEVLHPWLHRLEHASFALLVYTGLYAGLLGFYQAGAGGVGALP